MDDNAGKLVKLVILGDAHIRDQTWTGARLHGDTLLAASEVVDYAVNEGAVLVQPGDLQHVGLNLETPRNTRDIAAMMSKVPKVVHAVGNHDRPKAPPGRENPEWVETWNIKKDYQDVIGTVRVGTEWFYEENTVHTVDGVRFVVIHHVYGQEAFNRKLQDILDANLKFDVLVMHQYLKQVFGVVGAWEADSSELAAKLAGTGCRLVICGHTHRAYAWVEADKTGVLSPVTFVSPGETYPMTPQQAHNRHMFPVITVELGGADPERITNVEVEWRDIKSMRRVEHIVAEGEPASYEAALAKVDELVKYRSECKLPVEISTPYLGVSCEPLSGFVEQMRERAGTDVFLAFTWLSSPEVKGAEVADVGHLDTDDEDFATQVITSSYSEGTVRDVLLAVHTGVGVEAAVETQLRRILEEEGA